MGLKRWHLVLVFLVFLILSSGFYYTVQYPTYDIYDGPLFFDGEKAYYQLQQFVSQFPDRYIGTESNLEGAKWIKEYFKSLGLQVEIQGFEIKAPSQEKIMNRGLVTSGEDFFQLHKGYNVMGIFPGKRDEIILIGAHRDTIFTIEGAEDNGSGTILMLQLAEILSQRDNNYTYMFLSFDGEEIGLIGSEKFAQNYSHLDIALAVSIDMVGWKDADIVGFYPFATDGKRSELWVYSLARQIAGSSNIEYPTKTNMILETLKTVNSTIPTDSEPFIRRGIPGMGIYVTKEGVRGYIGGRNIHNPRDTMEQISPESIQMAGEFMERLIYTIDMGAIDTGYTSFYFPRDNSYVPGGYLYLYYGILLFFLFLIIIFDFYKLKEMLPDYKTIILREVPYAVAAILASIVITQYWLKMAIGSINNTQAIFLVIIGLLFPFIIMFGLVIVRSRAKTYRNPTTVNRLVLVCFFGILLTMGLFIDFYRTIILMPIPIIFFVYFDCNKPSKYLALLPLIAFFPLLLILIRSKVFSLNSFESSLFFIWFLTVFILSGLYILAKPRTTL